MVGALAAASVETGELGHDDPDRQREREDQRLQSGRDRVPRVCLRVRTDTAQSRTQGSARERQRGAGGDGINHARPSRAAGLPSEASDSGSESGDGSAPRRRRGHPGYLAVACTSSRFRRLAQSQRLMLTTVPLPLWLEAAVPSRPCPHNRRAQPAIPDEVRKTALGRGVWGCPELAFRLIDPGHPGHLANLAASMRAVAASASAGPSPHRRPGSTAVV